MAEPVLLVEQPEGIASVEVPAYADARRVRGGVERSGAGLRAQRVGPRAHCGRPFARPSRSVAAARPSDGLSALFGIASPSDGGHHLLLDHIVEQRGACCQRDARSECVFNFADGSQRDACVACVSDILLPSALTRVVLPARALRLCAGTARSERHRGSPRRGCRGRNRENVCPTQTARAGSRDTGRRPNRSTRRA